MKNLLQLAVALCWLGLTPSSAFTQGKLVDSVVAVVDGRVITLDQWQQQERFEALMQNRRATEVVPGEASLSRLIDNQLVVKNRTSVAFAPVTPEEVNQQLAAVRKQLSGGATDEGWKRLLATYGLREDEVKDQLADQLNTLRFIDARFRPGARITTEQVSAYYRDIFVPDFRKEAPTGNPPALAEVTDRITRILTEQLMDQRFAGWLQNLRAQARVQRITSLPQPNPTTASPTPH